MAKKIHFNAALHPESHVLPACMIGIIGSTRARADYRGTTKKERVTCARCLTMAEAEKKRLR